VKPVLWAATAAYILAALPISSQSKQSPQFVGEPALGIYRDGTSCGVDFATSDAASDLTLSLVRFSGGTEFLVISTGSRRFYRDEKQFDLIVPKARFQHDAANKRFKLSFHPTEAGLLVFELDPDSAPFMDALVSGDLIPFAPSQRKAPSTMVQLPGGGETYRALCRCAEVSRP
jgi:hypothetical protein